MSSANGTMIKNVIGTSTLVRPKFGPGMLLQHDDLEQLANYTRDLSRLMFRSLFGCGIVCGLKVDVTQNHCGIAVTVDAGLAISCSGDPIEVPDGQRIVVDTECDRTFTKLWVLLCPASKFCAPRPSACGSGEDLPSVCTRERLGFEIRVVSDLSTDCFCGLRENEKPSCFEANPCACANALHPAYVDHYQGACGNCSASDCGCCSCVVLGALVKVKEAPWSVNHRVRRVTRPVLMCDWIERPPKTPKAIDQSTTQPTVQEAEPPVAQDATAEVAQEAAQEAAAQVAQAAEPQVAEEAAARVAQEAAVKVTQETTAQNAQAAEPQVAEAAERVTPEVAAQVAKEVAALIAKELPAQIAKEVAAQIAQAATKKKQRR